MRRLIAGVDRRRFLRDQQVRYAVERAAEIIGEAVRNLSPEFRARHPDVPWKAIIAQRNILIHRYWEVDPGLLWKLATVHIPELMKKVEPLAPLGAEEE